MEEDGEDQLDRTQNELRSAETGGRKEIVDGQKNLIGHILRDDSLQREIMEGRGEEEGLDNSS